MNFTKIIFLIGFLMLTINSIAQPGGGGDPGPGQPVPISGLEILLVSGGILGAKKIIEMTRRNQE
jgi:hypothetical protein